VPLEGHWERVNTPLRRLTRRERNVMICAVLATIAAIVVLVALTASDSRPAPGPGCIYAIVPGAMGAAPVDGCGARARNICANHATLDDPGSRAIQADCRRAGLL
jgi:peptidoglycan/LPS O-acetylase OafA/YrhL